VAARSSVAVRPPEDAPRQWFASWFDSPHYHRLYGYRDEAEAIGFVDALVERLRPASGARVLDLGCGGGRHARELHAKGLDVLGLDLAASSITSAKPYENEHLRFRRHDMRVPFGTSAFDYVFSFFTSFGYFERMDEHVKVVENVAGALRPGGRLVLDYLNAAYADRRLVAEEMREVDGTVYHIARWTDAGRFFKHIIVDEGSLAPMLEFREQVARFTIEDFSRMFAICGLTIEAVYGDYRLGRYDEVKSPRMVMVARKPYERRRHPAVRLRRPRRRSAGRSAGAVLPYAAHRLRRDAEV